MSNGSGSNLTYRRMSGASSGRTIAESSFGFSKRLYKLRWRIESAFNRLKDFRRVATRYDKLARNYLASVCLAAALVWWI
jgi:transposase